MGLALAEAQMAGVCVASSPGQVRDEMLCPEAAVSYDEAMARTTNGQSQIR